ncbi:MAG: ribonuclease III [Mycoplasmataceae bacterium]|nr:ribonuclease III [Mycoplasmataceae bacterium]
MNQINNLLKSIGIEANNIELYLEALTHKSYTNENGGKDYQVMEFFGDAIVDLVASEYIYNKFPNLNEGEMSILRSNSVSGKQLAKFALELNINEYSRFGNNSKGLPTNPKILEDMFEALVCAIYKDQGMEVVKDFLSKNVLLFIKNSGGKELKNPKTLLQELLQSGSRGIIKYNTVQENNKFSSQVTHDDMVFGKGIGNTKKEAEVNAALKALGKLK